MQVNTEKVKDRFARAMNTYEKNAVVQAGMAQKLIKAVCGYGNEFDKILELGTGTGLLTKELVAHLNYKTYYANDLIEKSKEYLDKILPRYTFISGNAKDIEIPERVNLIISNAMFQWFKDIDFLHFADLLEKGGLLAFTTFSPENFREIREVSGLSLKYKSVDEIRVDMNVYFKILHVEEYLEVINFNLVSDILYHIKSTGVNVLSNSHWSSRKVFDFCDRYEKKFKDLCLTYAPIIVIGEKKYP